MRWGRIRSIIAMAALSGALGLVVADRPRHPAVQPVPLPAHILRLSRYPANELRTALDQAIKVGTVRGGMLRVESEGHNPFVYTTGTDLKGMVIRDDSLFDVASLTKGVATAPLILQYVAQGRFTLETPLQRWFPWMKEDHRVITIGQLLLHASGLPAGPSHALGTMPEEAIAREPLHHTPGTNFLYSDLDYILLGRILEKESGESLDRLAVNALFRPAGMTDTAFRPTPDRRKRCVSTLGADRTILTGVVQDPLARELGGVAGHAGIFSSATDLARLGRLLLDNGSVDGRQVLRPAAVRYLTTPEEVDPRSYRTYGMDALTSYSAPKGDLLSFGSYGHTGYTGCSLWMDPSSRTVILLLTSGVTDKTRRDLGELRRTIANLIAGSLD